MGFLDIEELENLTAPAVTAGEIVAFGLGIAGGVLLGVALVAT